jgi:hypothetical protein
VLRRALEDDKLFAELRSSFPESISEEELRIRIRSHLAWQRHTRGEPHFCSYCGRAMKHHQGEVIVTGPPDEPRWYRAVCDYCRTGKNQPRDAGRES